MLHCVAIHQLVDRHLGCFHFVSIMNNFAMNICVQFLYEYVFISLGFILRCGIAGSYGNPLLLISRVLEELIFTILPEFLMLS